MRLIMMRHGETLWNSERRLQDQDNSQLSERGIEQARRFAPYAQALAPASVVASDLGRTRQTADLLGFGHATPEPRLRELDMGSWTGRIKNELIEARPDDYFAWRAGAYTPPGGESWQAFRQRVAAAIRDWLEQAQGDLLAIVHGGVIRAACHEFVGLPPANVVPVTPGTATILRFRSSNAETARLEGYNIGASVPDAHVAD